MIYRFHSYPFLSFVQEKPEGHPLDLKNLYDPLLERVPHDSVKRYRISTVSHGLLVSFPSRRSSSPQHKSAAFKFEGNLVLTSEIDFS